MSENKRASASPAETLRKRVRQAERDAGERPGLTSDERASAFIFSAISVGTPPQGPDSTSILLNQSFSVCAKRPIFGAINWIAEYRDECSASCIEDEAHCTPADLSGELTQGLAHAAPPPLEWEPPANRAVRMRRGRLSVIAPRA